VKIEIISKMKYKIPFFLISLLAVIPMFSQVAEANELVKIHETTLTEMNTIANQETGSLVYNTTINAMHYYNGTTWVQINTETTGTVGHFIISGTGTQTITGLPFKPSSISFIAHANIESESINSDNAVGNNNNGIDNTFGNMNGYARNDNGVINQQVSFVGGSGNSINDITRYANDSQCIGLRYTNNNGDNIGLTTASVTAFNNYGFTINVSAVSDNILVIYTAYK
jgi:hypothetical protein